jgi:hypothetical protein
MMNALRTNRRIDHFNIEESTPKEQRNIFAKDDRVAVKSPAFPCEAIGKLSTSGAETLIVSYR